MNDEKSHFNLPIPPGRRDEWAIELAQKTVEKAGGAVTNLFLFRVGAEWFGVDARMLSMTMPDSRPRRLPHRRNSPVEGVINADGRVVTCLSMERLWTILPAQVESGQKRLLIFDWSNWRFAIRADEVLGVEGINEALVQPLPLGSPENLRKCGHGVVRHSDRVVIWLDPDAFVERLQEALL